MVRPINSNTLLTNVLKRDGLTYQNAFQIGTLSYSGRKGGRALGANEFEITADFDRSGLHRLHRIVIGNPKCATGFAESHSGVGKPDSRRDG